MFKKLQTQLTPAQAIERLESDDPTLTHCNLANNVVMQMKGPELMPKLAAALEKNTKCIELDLSGCGLTDPLIVPLGAALGKNSSLVHVNLQENKIGNDGATSLAGGLATNRVLMQLNLFGQKGTKFGDATLHAFTAMFDTNVTLLKIVWRLESRQSFALNKKLIRNNDIDKRIRDGKDYAELLPSGVAPLSAALIAQRNASNFSIGVTPRTSTADPAAESPRISTAALRTSAVSNRSSASDAEPVSALKATPFKTDSNSELEAALAALDTDYNRELAELKKKYADKKAQLMKSMRTSAVAVS